MQIPGWQTLALRAGVLPEPLPGSHGLVLWLPGEQRDGFLHWERVGNVANAAVVRQAGLCATPATAVRVRQRLRGFFGTLLGRFRAAPLGRTWTLPGGEAAEQVGERQTDLLLVWPEGEDTVLDEAQLRSRWPHSQRIRQLGEHLFLVSGIAPPAGDPATPRQWEPRQAAEALLAAARQSGDRRGEIAALTDLGIIHTRACAGQQALTVLEEALTLARQSGAPSLEADVVNHLGLAALTAGQPARALQLLEQGLDHARGTGDRFAEKGALDRLGEAYGRLRAPDRALGCYEQARMLAQELGDRQHEADLLWHQGIQYAELGQRDQAVARAEAAIALLRTLGNPQAGWLAGHLQTYRVAEEGSRLAEGGVIVPGTRADAPYGSQVIAGGWAGTTQAPVGGKQAGGPGFLRMAIASVKSMATFLASGLKTTPSVLHRQRVGVCATCEHHTGLRCKLCGCFTHAKAWLPHERCPVGKWPV